MMNKTYADLVYREIIAPSFLSFEYMII